MLLPISTTLLRVPMMILAICYSMQNSKDSGNQCRIITLLEMRKHKKHQWVVYNIECQSNDIMTSWCVRGYMNILDSFKKLDHSRLQYVRYIHTLDQLDFVSFLVLYLPDKDIRKFPSFSLFPSFALLLFFKIAMQKRISFSHQQFARATVLYF